MFLSRRATQAEYFDAPGRPASEIAEMFESLARINRLCVFAEAFKRSIPKLFGDENCRSLSFLDLGAGDGSLGATLRDWAQKERGWDWRFTNLDFSLPTLRLSKSGCNIAGSVLALPFRESSFDLVVASQMTHHLAHDEEVILHLKEAWRVTRKGIVFSDLHRGFFLYGLLWLLLLPRRYPRSFRSDALLSVERGFRVGELRALAERAGIPGAQTSLYFGTRVILQARKATS